MGFAMKAWDDDETFYEEDEPINNVLAVFERGVNEVAVTQSSQLIDDLPARSFPLYVPQPANWPTDNPVLRGRTPAPAAG
jgi:hypothetical protein